jgi:hypothetical protein
MLFAKRFWGIGTQEGIAVTIAGFKSEAQRNRCKGLKILNSVFQDLSHLIIRGFDPKVGSNFTRNLLTEMVEMLVKYFKQDKKNFLWEPFVSPLLCTLSNPV